jgi:hypothetical protein
MVGFRFFVCRLKFLNIEQFSSGGLMKSVVTGTILFLMVIFIGCKSKEDEITELLV